MNQKKRDLMRNTVLLFICLTSACLAGGENSSQPETTRAGWESMFNGKTLEGWEITPFGGEGPVTVKDGAIQLSYGVMLTGITWKGDFPKVDYEIELEASRVQGSDFFLGLTFPVKESFCSLILGGWGGAVVGLSSIDGFDASENETTLIRGFKRGQWYKVLLRVTGTIIQVSIDGEQIITVDTTGKEISTRPEVLLSRPVGIASFQTWSAIRNIWYREL